MAITNGYTTLQRFKDALKITDTNDDTRIERAVEDASRLIDDYCRRRFYAATETRYYGVPDDDNESIRVDDLISVTTLKTDADGDRTYETTWASTDYELEPVNAADDGRPFTRVYVTPLGRYTFPSGRRTTEIAGSFGYCSAAPGAAGFPSVVERACIFQANRLMRRADTPFGIAGNAGEFGTSSVIPRLDPDVQELLYRLRRLKAGS